MSLNVLGSLETIKRRSLSRLTPWPNYAVAIGISMYHEITCIISARMVSRTLAQKLVVVVFVLPVISNLTVHIVSFQFQAYLLFREHRFIFNLGYGFVESSEVCCCEELYDLRQKSKRGKKHSVLTLTNLDRQ